jgi:DNA-binding CsgD family transcriptional regulator
MMNTPLSDDAVSLYMSLALDGEGPLVNEVGDSAPMTELKAMGLVSQVSGPPPEVIVASPEEAFDRMLIVARESARQALSSLTCLLGEINVLERRRWAMSVPDAPMVEVLDGTASIARAAERLRAKAADEYLAVIVNRGLALGWPCGPDLRTESIPGRARLLWAREVWGAVPGAESRVTTTTQMDARITDGREALVAFPGHPDKALLVRSPGIVTLLRSWFEVIWERSSPVQSVTEPTWPYRQRILTLLATGYRDAEVARATGTSVRTVRRHMAEVMRVVGASTRFQVGLEASRRGWLVPSPGVTRTR